MRKIANPYMLFGIAWTLCLCLYTLGWSELFPKISAALFIFLTASILIFLITGFLYGKIKINFAPATEFTFRYKKLLIINFFIFSLNFFYSGVPILTGTRDMEFGMPTVIVLATALNSFCAVYCFYLFLIYKNKNFLFYSSLCLLLFLMEYSRGLIMMNLFTMFFLWINVKKTALTFKKGASIAIGILVVLYLFGVAGNYRVINEISARDPNSDKVYNNDIILNVGEASDSFRKNLIPNEFFWSYIYITSPLSNLQYNITIHSPQLTFSGVFDLIIDELLFDAVSKRIDKSLNRQKITADLLVQNLTVPTTLANSYDNAGWPGMGIFMFIFWTIPLFYSLLIINNPYGVMGSSVLCTIYVLSIFDNMLILSGLSLQLLFPVIMFFLDRIKVKKPVLISEKL